MEHCKPGRRCLAVLSLLLGTLFLEPGLNAQLPVDDGPPPLDCDAGLYPQLKLESLGYPLRGGSVEVSAGLSKVVFQDQACQSVRIFDIPSTPSTPLLWEVVERPAGATPVLTGAGTLTASMTIPAAGRYRLRFTLCPGGCLFPAGPEGNLPLEQSSTEITLDAVDSLHLPPEIEPASPRFARAATQPTPFSSHDRDIWCQYGGGLVDPQWVSVNEWMDSGDYVLLEGNVLRSRISRKDSFLNHDSMDHNFAVRADPLYFYLLSTAPEFSSDRYLLGIEWERASFPERVWPTVGDRASVFGYWIFDCGHEPYYTEVHPAVGVAVHRARPVLLPDNALFTMECPPGPAVRARAGSNVFVPGIVTDIWFNRSSGEITSNCSWTGLHQKGREVTNPFPPPPKVTADGACIQGPAPIRREFVFHIFLPRSPQAVYEEAGATVPAVPLHIAVSNPAGLSGPGQPGPEPEITRVRDPGDDVDYLRVRLDLRSFTGSAYSRRITAAWVYPSPDNWGLRRWRLSLNSMVVHDDADANIWTPLGTIQNDGDWRFYLNTPNGSQEWTRLFDCDGCVHGTHTFTPAWRTGTLDPVFFRSLGTTDSQRRLGPDLLLYPGQPIWVHTSGFDEDTAFHDDTGTVNATYPQAEADPSPRSTKASGEYTLRLQIRQGTAVGNASLSSEALSCIYEKYRLTAGQPVPPRNVAIADWLPISLNPGLSPGRSARPPWKVDGAEAGGLLGASVGPAGDVNGDGYPDLIVGAPGSSQGEGGEGLAFVYLGIREGLPSEPAWTGQGNMRSAGFGSSVAGAGDVDGDGFSEVVVGAPSFDNGGVVAPLPAGRAFLFSGTKAGPALEPSWQATGGQNYGFSVAAAGDPNGDGFADVLVGAPRATVNRDLPEAGAVFLYLGSSRGLSATPAWFAAGERAGALFGHSLASAGDVNGDNLSDVVIGAPDHGNPQVREGKVYLYLGAKTPQGLGAAPSWTRESDRSEARLGFSVASAGDVNGDQVSDLLLGAPGWFTDDARLNEGRAFLHPGVRNGVPAAQPSWQLGGGEGGALLGYSVASAGDIDGDGFADLLLGAPFAGRGLVSKGRVLVYRGSRGGPGPDLAFALQDAGTGALFGSSVAPAADLNKDGFADFVVGAPRHSQPGQGGGRACVNFGWGPAEIEVSRTTLYLPQGTERTLAEMEPEQLRQAIDLGRESEPETVEMLLLALRAFMDEGLRGPRRLDALEEIAVLRSAIPDDLWEKHFGQLQLFIRGDSNADRALDLSDGIHVLASLFTGGAVLSCRDAGDSNDDGALDISDPIYLLGYLFTGTNYPPPYPFMEPGLDPTEDRLDCRSY